MIIKDANILRQISEKITSKEEALDIINKLQEELNYQNTFGINGVGLAAIQIGIPKQVAIIRLNEYKLDIVNCSIHESNNKIIGDEGCLSLPGESCKIERMSEIVIKNNELGNINNFVAFGLVSVCVQHEMDHWFGKLITDKAIKPHTNVGDNTPCPCGSKIKYKKCCKKKGT